MNKLKPIDAGRFSRQLTIENEVEVADGLGGFSKTYQAADTVWAHICPLSVSAMNEADAQVSKVTHRILLRFRAGVSAGSRFVTGTRRFHVETVRDPDETGRYLECMAVERP